MSVHQQQARDLIDLVADAMDDHPDRKHQMEAGRHIVFAYHQMHPNHHYAFHQASIYISLRLELEPV